MRKIAISDIHGCFQTFKYLLEQEVELQKTDELYLLGDYVDRGPASKEVIDYILLLRHRGFQVHCLLGNHEEMMLQAPTDSIMRDIWERNGGMQTKDSFGILAADELSKKYHNFLSSLKHYLIVDDYILVHAGLNFKKKNPLTDQNALIWARHWENNIDYGWLGDRKVIYGHTPHSKQDIEQKLATFDTGRFICIDGGCVFDYLPGLGHLCAFDFTNHQLYFTANID